MQPNNRNQVITSRVTLEQKNVYILNAENKDLSRSEWIAETLDNNGSLLEASIDILQDELEVKNKLVNRLTNQLENADEYIAILEKKNIVYKNKIARLLNTIDQLKQPLKTENFNSKTPNFDSQNQPFYILGSIAVLVSALVLAAK